MPVRIQDEIADPGEVLKEIDLPGVLGSGFIVEGSASRHTIDVDAAKLDYPSEISSMMLHHAAPEAQYSETPRRWHLFKNLLVDFLVCG